MSVIRPSKVRTLTTTRKRRQKVDKRYIPQNTHYKRVALQYQSPALMEAKVLQGQVVRRQHLLYYYYVYLYEKALSWLECFAGLHRLALPTTAGNAGMESKLQLKYTMARPADRCKA